MSKCARILFLAASLASQVFAAIPVPEGDVELKDAVILINENTRLQVNLELRSLQKPDFVRFTVDDWWVFNQDKLHRMIARLEGYTLLHSESALTIVPTRTPSEPDYLSTVLTNFAVTNIALGHFGFYLCNRVPFDLEMLAPLLTSRVTKPDLTRGWTFAMEHWPTEDLLHLVTVLPAKQNVRDLLSSVYNPHFKSYWVAHPVETAKTNFNGLFIHIYRHDEFRSLNVLDRLKK